MKHRYAVGLGVLPRVPRQRRSHPQGASTSCRYVPVGPMLVAVLGLQDAKAGRMPTEDEHALLAKLLHEAFDAGGCGWTAQRLPPTGPAAVQRDWDGTPMPDRHDERRDVPGLRPGAGRAQPWRAADDADHQRCEATTWRCSRSWPPSPGRPMLHNVIQAFADRPHIHRRGHRVAGALPRAGHPGVRPGCHQRRRVHLHARGLESLRRFRDVDGGDPPDRWRSACTSWPTPARRQGLKDTQLPSVATAPHGRR